MLSIGERLPMIAAANGAATMGVGATGTANMRAMERGTMGGAATVAESIWDPQEQKLRDQ
jgi:hypothetical protein